MSGRYRTTLAHTLIRSLSLAALAATVGCAGGAATRDAPPALAAAEPSRETASVDRAAIASLDALAAAEDYPTLLARLTRPSSGLQARSEERWLENRLQSGVASVVLAGPYARRLMAAGRSDEAHFWYLYGVIAIQVDAARCHDVSAPLARVRAWRRATQDQASAFEALPSIDRAAIARAVLNYEARTASVRRTDRWLCAGGVDYWNAYFARHPDRRGGDRRTLPRDLSIPIYAVEDRVWQAKRSQIRTVYRAAFVDAPAPRVTRTGPRTRDL